MRHRSAMGARSLLPPPAAAPPDFGDVLAATLVAACADASPMPAAGAALLSAMDVTLRAVEAVFPAPGADPRSTNVLALGFQRRRQGGLGNGLRGAAGLTLDAYYPNTLVEHACSDPTWVALHAAVGAGRSCRGRVCLA